MIGVEGLRQEVARKLVEMEGGVGARWLQLIAIVEVRSAILNEPSNWRIEAVGGTPREREAIQRALAIIKLDHPIIRATD